MTARENYLEQKKRREDRIKNDPMFKVFMNQEKRWIEPFRIFGNVYYAGDSWVCVHLIDTGDGLLLIDCGNCGNTAMLVKAIYDLGFRPDDVKWIILSHGHVDHVGGAVWFRNMFGTKLYLGEPDAVMFREKPEFSFIQDSTDFLNDVFEPDVCIREGDILSFGNLTVKCYLVPGHTEGCVALFFDGEEDGRKKHFGYYGGFGFNTLTKEHLDEYGDHEYRMWNTYAESIDKVADFPVDIFLGNHTENNRFFEKLDTMKRTGSRECFIDSAEWKSYLLAKKEELKSFVEKQKALNEIN